MFFYYLREPVPCRLVEYCHSETKSETQNEKNRSNHQIIKTGGCL